MRRSWTEGEFVEWVEEDGRAWNQNLPPLQPMPQAWLLRECDEGDYSLGIRARLKAVHQATVMISWYDHSSEHVSCVETVSGSIVEHCLSFLQSSGMTEHCRATAVNRSCFCGCGSNWRRLRVSRFWAETVKRLLRSCHVNSILIRIQTHVLQLYFWHVR